MSFLPLPVGLVLLLALGLSLPIRHRSRVALFGLLVVSGVLLGSGFPVSGTGPFTQDPAAILFQGLVLLAAILALLFPWDQDRIPSLLWATLGAMLLVTANDLGSMFLALELTGLASLFLLPVPGRSKAFGYGMLASASFFFGAALLYGMTGTSAIPTIAGRLSGALPVAILAAVLMVSGLLAKLMAPPFHQWAPDALEPAEPSALFFHLTIPPLAAFAALSRLLTFALATTKGSWAIPLLLALVLAWFFLQPLALSQQTGRGFLVWMGIAQGTFALLALAGFNPGFSEGMAAAWVHWLSLILALAGLAAVFSFVGPDLRAIQGLWGRSRLMASTALVSLLILAGLPPTLGFWGKYFLMQGSFAALPGLGLLFGLALLLSLYASLRLARWLFLPAEGALEHPEPPVPILAVALVVLASGVLFFLLPGWLWSTGLRAVFGF